MIKFILTHFFLFCLLLIGSLFYYLTMTTPGLQTDIELATSLLAGKLRIESADGKLFSDFALHNVTFQNSSQSIRIHSFALSWNPIGLLLHKLIINSIQMDHATFLLSKISTPSNEIKNQHSFLNDIIVKKARLKRIAIRLANTEISINGNVEKNWNMRWNAIIPDISTVLPESKGLITTSGNISGPFLSPHIKAEIEGKNTSYANQHLKRWTGSIALEIDRDKKIVTTHLNFLVNNRYSIVGEFTLPKFAGINERNQPITGQVVSSLRDLNGLTNYIPQMKNPRGTLRALLFIKGTLKTPDVTLNLNLINGNVQIPSLGISPQAIYLQGITGLDKQLRFSGHFKSGKGHATLQGSVDLNDPNYPVSLQVNGSELQAIHLAEYHILITPTLTLHFVKQNLAIEGTILVPYAKIMPKNFGSTITLPSDVVFVNSKQPTALPFTTRLQLTLKLGDSIHLEYQNLKANLGGEVELNQVPGALINAVGEFYTKNGQYTAYGQTLTIKTGRLIYTGGSLMNPGVTLSAVKHLKMINTGGNISSFTGETSLHAVYGGTQALTVGVDVSGTLENPEFSVFSTPSLSQADIMSYLVFGFPQSQANGNQYGAIISALSSLNPNTPSVGDFTKNIEQKLGLTEIGIQSIQVFNPNATSNSHSVISTTSFVVGKKLSDNLSIHYSVGIFYPVSILNLRYKLAKHWAIQSETSTLDNGADILYSIERD